MQTTTIEIDTIREIIHSEVDRALRELLDEIDFLSEDDFHDREEAMRELGQGNSVDWAEYKKKRGKK